ncbi:MULTISPECIES: hypothetical protein [Anaerotruncus]|nr:MULTISPECIES: hypothetical protein [Anaerotruncus]
MKKLLLLYLDFCTRKSEDLVNNYLTLKTVRTWDDLLADLYSGEFSSL